MSIITESMKFNKGTSVSFFIPHSEEASVKLVNKDGCIEIFSRRIERGLTRRFKGARNFKIDVIENSVIEIKHSSGVVIDASHYSENPFTYRRWMREFHKRVSMIVGKPGSGVSTVAKIFRNQILDSISNRSQVNHRQSLASNRPKTSVLFIELDWICPSAPGVLPGSIGATFTEAETKPVSTSTTVTSIATVTVKEGLIEHAISKLAALVHEYTQGDKRDDNVNIVINTAMDFNDIDLIKHCIEKFRVDSTICVADTMTRHMLVSEKYLAFNINHLNGVIPVNVNRKNQITLGKYFKMDAGSVSDEFVRHDDLKFSDHSFFMYKDLDIHMSAYCSDDFKKIEGNNGEKTKGDSGLTMVRREGSVVKPRCYAAILDGDNREVGHAYINSVNKETCTFSAIVPRAHVGGLRLLINNVTREF